MSSVAPPRSGRSPGTSKNKLPLSVSGNLFFSLSLSKSMVGICLIKNEGKVGWVVGVDHGGRVKAVERRERRPPVVSHTMY